MAALSTTMSRFITTMLAIPAIYLESTTFVRLRGEAHTNLFQLLALS